MNEARTKGGRMVSFESTPEQLSRIDRLAAELDPSAKRGNRSLAIRTALDVGLAALSRKRKKTG